jgi:plastocyanin
MKYKLILLFAITISIAGCKKDDDTTSGSPGTNEVWMQNMAFNPSTITIAAHTTIKWTNKDSNTHNVTSNTGVFASGNLSKDASFSFTFDSVGTFAYKCTIHPSMTGSVIVH